MRGWVEEYVYKHKVIGLVDYYGDSKSLRYQIYVQEHGKDQLTLIKSAEVFREKGGKSALRVARKEVKAIMDMRG